MSSQSRDCPPSQSSEEAGRRQDASHAQPLAKEAARPPGVGKSSHFTQAGPLGELPASQHVLDNSRFSVGLAIQYRSPNCARLFKPKFK